MRLLLVNQHYPPDSGATGRLLAQLAEALADRGHEVEVLTGKPTYEEARGLSAPRRETVRGVRVHRLPMLPRRNGALSRTLHYLAFAISSLGAGLLHRRPDAVLAFSSTPMFGGIAAAALARAKRCPFVYVVQDVYPEIAQAMGVVRARPVAAIARFLEAAAWRGAERVVLIGEELHGVAASRAVGGARLATIANWADLDTIRPLEESAFRTELGFAPSDFVVEYAGNFGRSQDLDAVLEAARLVEERTAGPEGAAAGRVRFLLVGEGSASADVRRRARDLPNVSVAPYQPEERLGDVLAAADLSLIPLRSGLTRFCVPSKVYSILASGRPVGAALDGDSEVARIVQNGRCGFRVDPEDPTAMAEEILALASDRERAREMGRNGRAYGEKTATLDRAVKEYEALLSDVSESVKNTRA
ncbi:glycosyltransferase family 4 protein [bacterium]|nr:glycosyltransferase family 4 protein [bacterium]